jgi:hypothetical protein
VLLLFLLSLTSAQAPQPVVSEATVGATRPHVEVIKDLPESQLFPVMNEIADSLGVTCEHCHVRTTPNPTTVVGGWVWDRDDKPAKAAGRRMLKMVRDLNAANFNGRAEVTCFTCHRGSLRPQRVPPLPPTQAEPPAPPALPGAADIIASYKTAVGGEVASRFATTVLTATDDRSEDRHGTFEMQLKQAGKSRMTIRLPNQGDVVQALDGETGWVTSQAGTRLLRPDEVQALKRITLRFEPVKILDLPATVRVRGIENVRDRPSYVLQAAIDPGTTRRWYFDVETHLLVREWTARETLVVPLQDQIDYEDYRDVDGVKLPFTIRASDGAPYATSLRRFTRIVHGVPLDDDLFKAPVVRQ